MVLYYSVLGLHGASRWFRESQSVVAVWNLGEAAQVWVTSMFPLLTTANPTHSPLELLESTPLLVQAEMEGLPGHPRLRRRLCVSNRVATLRGDETRLELVLQRSSPPASTLLFADTEQGSDSKIGVTQQRSTTRARQFTRLILPSRLTEIWDQGNSQAQVLLTFFCDESGRKKCISYRDGVDAGVPLPQSALGQCVRRRCRTIRTC
jgi:hypothetical protein